MMSWLILPPLSVTGAQEPRFDLHHLHSFFISILMTKTTYCEIEMRECTIGAQTFGPKLCASMCVRTCVVGGECWMEIV